MENTSVTPVGSIGVPVEFGSTADDLWQRYVIEGRIRLLPYGGNLACGIYLTFVGICATIGNSLVVITVLKSRKLRKKPHNILLVNMAFSDLNISVFGYPFTTMSGYAGRYLFSHNFCIAQGFFCFLFAQSSMNTLAVLSIYRYIAVCLPHYRHLIDMRRTKYVIIGTWIYTLLCVAPPLMGWSRYTWEPFGTSCSYDWMDPSEGTIAYTYFLFVTCYLFHVIIMSFTYFKIYQKSKTLKLNTRYTMNVEEAAQCVEVKGEIKVSVMCLVMVSVFTVVWSPYTFVCLWGVYDPNMPLWISTLPTMFAKLASMLNPFIYAATNPVFRAALYQLLCPGRNKVHSEEGKQVRRTSTIYTIDRTKEGIYIGTNEIRLGKTANSAF